MVTSSASTVPGVPTWKSDRLILPVTLNGDRLSRIWMENGAEINDVPLLNFEEYNFSKNEPMGFPAAYHLSTGYSFLNFIQDE